MKGARSGRLKFTWSRRITPGTFDVEGGFSDDEDELDPSLPGLLPPPVLKLLTFFGSRTYSAVSVILTVIHLVLATWTIHTNTVSAVANFERRGWYFTYHIWAFVCPVLLNRRIPRYLRSAEYARFVRKGGGVTGSTRRFFFISSAIWGALVCATGAGIAYLWFRPANRPGYTGSGSRTSHERVTSWLMLIWLPISYSVTFTLFLLAYFLLCCRQRVMAFAREVEACDVVKPRAATARRFSIEEGGPRARVPGGGVLSEPEVSALEEAQKALASTRGGDSVADLLVNVGTGIPNPLWSPGAPAAPSQRDLPAANRSSTHGRISGMSAWALNSSGQGLSGGGSVSAAALGQSHRGEGHVDSPTRESAMDRTEHLSASGGEGGGGGGSGGDGCGVFILPVRPAPEQSQSAAEDTAQGMSSWGKLADSHNGGHTATRSSEVAMPEPSERGESGRSYGMGGGGQLSRARKRTSHAHAVLGASAELTASEFQEWCVQQCREIAHDTCEVARLTAVAIATGSFVVVAFWIQLFLLVANKELIWGDIHAVTSLTSTLGMTVLLMWVVFMAAFCNDAAERFALQVPFMSRAFPKIHERVAFGTAMLHFKPLQVKIGFYPISWSTFFQLLLFFVGAWGGTFIKILTDIDQKYKHGGVN